MGFMSQLFTPQELEALDEQEAKILRDAVLEQIQASPEINALLRKMLNRNSEGQS